MLTDIDQALYPTVVGDVTLRFEGQDRSTCYERQNKILLTGNEDFGRVVELCDGTATIAKILDLLMDSYDSAAFLHGILHEIINELQEEGLVELHNSAQKKNISVQHCDFIYPLDTVYLEPTRLCNQMCIHCYACSPSHSVQTQKTAELSDLELSSLFDELRSIGVLNVCFTGGEPFFRKGFLKILRECHLHGFDIGLFTNGTLLNDEIIDAMEFIDPKFIALSLDSIDPCIYEKIRGKRSLDIVLRNLQKILNKNIQARINCILFNGLNDSLRGLVEYLSFLKNMNVKPSSITFDQFSPEGEGAAKDYLSPNPKALIGRVKEAFEVVYGWQVPTSSFSPEGATEPGDYCGLGTSMINIKSDGSISLCPALAEPEHVIGNVRDGIGNIWKNSGILDYFRTNSHIGNSTCKQCPSLKECRGGCKAKSLTFNSDLNSPDPWMCAYFNAGQATLDDYGSNM